ncbi:hypothetical protein [Streptomyces sp. IMTB 2501]|uniref:hypothetical protein n=1 Tax=Streptomyces sp. IMTB 2501 TaxID=1776340 RepID=UPI0011802C91|nr:hypothetical protein [Streptomyces sp. IMTB 2501]
MPQGFVSEWDVKTGQGEIQDANGGDPLKFSSKDIDTEEDRIWLEKGNYVSFEIDDDDARHAIGIEKHTKGFGN